MQRLSQIIEAPAKINLALAVTNKRADGMHSLETVFQTISLCDRIEVSLAKNGIVCHCGELSGEKNLAFKAASLFISRYQDVYPHDNRAGAEITIDKRIPQQAGLGGGSSDAAAVIKALNDLYSNPFSYPQLLELARKCGADTAFFLKGGTQWGEETGSQLTELPAAPEMEMILVKPESGVDTAQAYYIFDEIGSYSGLSLDVWRVLLKRGDKQAICKNLFNALEPAAFQLVSEIREIKILLRQFGCEGVLMTGSGSAVFGMIPDAAHREKVVSGLHSAGYHRYWIVRTIQSADLTHSRE